MFMRNVCTVEPRKPCLRRQGHLLSAVREDFSKNAGDLTQKDQTRHPSGLGAKSFADRKLYKSACQQEYIS